MNEAPKKIWFTPDEELASAGKLDDDDIPYIRADIVDELVKVLEAMGHFIYHTSLDADTLNIISKAALAKLEESHD